MSGIDLFAAPVGRTAGVQALLGARLAEVPVDRIAENPEQPRGRIDEDDEAFLELAESIRTHGLLQPIVVTRDEGSEERYTNPTKSAPDHRNFVGHPHSGVSRAVHEVSADGGVNPPAPTGAPVERYTLIAGERRWRAHIHLARTEPKFGRVMALVVPLEGGAPDRLMRALVENVVRAELQAGERARAISILRELTGWTYEEISHRLGMSLSRVRDLAALGRSEELCAAVDAGEIGQAQAVVVARAAKSPSHAAELKARVAQLDRDLARMAVSEELMVDGIIVRETPLGRVMRRRIASRDDVCAAIAETCAVLRWWPEPFE